MNRPVDPASAAAVAAEIDRVGGAAAAALQADVLREDQVSAAGGMALHSGSRGDG